MTSPYNDLPPDQWQQRTQQLILAHPLPANEIYAIVIKTWESIFRSAIGTKPFKIGQDIFPAPQIMGFFLHELIPLELAFRYPEKWRKGINANEKDLVYIPDEDFSVEIKTSSSSTHIYGNRSYAQTETQSKKRKSGYYLAINFEKFTPKNTTPSITLVRFGWLDHEDWIGQASATGQQARLSPAVEKNKLLSLPLSE